MIDWSAGTYELTAAQLAPAAERAVGAARITPGERVLDVACGTGNAAILAAFGGAQVTGVDQAERLLEVAAGRARAAGVEIDWQAADALALPFEDDAFDAVLSVFGVIFAPAEPAAAELVRVTAPEGRVVLVTWTGEGVIAAASGVMRRAMADAGALPGPDPSTVAPSAPAPGTPALASSAPAAAPGTSVPAAGASAPASDTSVSAPSAPVPPSVAPARTPGGDAASDGPDAARSSEQVTRDWGDPAELEALFAPFGGVVTIERYGHAFEASSPEAFADEWMDRHPMWLAARDVLGAETYAALREPLVAVLAEGNEDPDAFRGTSVALVAHVQLP